MQIKKATRVYEEWLSSQLPIVALDLKKKHRAMAHDPFSFLRATYYRWAQVFVERCPKLLEAPEVLSVGDLHVENFGTWRDREGRLVWGINDFDEAQRMPWSADLVRLAVSAHLAINAASLNIKASEACETILEGYRHGLETGGRPFVLSEGNVWLRDLASSAWKDPRGFWDKFDRLPTVEEALPKACREALERMLPEAGLGYRVVHRQAGVGSLGRQRFAAVTQWKGALVCREAKALIPSAWNLAIGKPRRTEVIYNRITSRAVRCADPYLSNERGWIVRRLAPDCMRIELTSLSRRSDQTNMLQAMGFETANVHLGTEGAKEEVLRHMKRLESNWLHVAMRAMTESVQEDFVEWKQAMAAV